MKTFGAISLNRKAVLTALSVLTSAVLLLGAPSVAHAAPQTLSGTVTFRGAPVAGVTVGAYNPLSKIKSSTTTDANGFYSLAAPNYAYVVYANIDVSNQYAGPQLARTIASFFGANGQSSFAYQTLQPAPAGSGADLNISLHAATKISGSNPLLANSIVRLVTASGGMTAGQLNADSGGHYSFAAVPGDYYLTAQQPTYDYLPYKSASFAVVEGSPVTVNPTFIRGAVIMGKATYDGKVKNGVPVILTYPSGETEQTYTSNGGKYSFIGLAAGNYKVQFGRTGAYSYTHGTYTVKSYRLDSVKVKTTRTQNVALTKAGSISGTFYAGKSARTSSYLIANARTGAEVAYGVNLYKSGINAINVGARGLSSGKYTVVVTNSNNTHWYQKTVSVAAGRTTSLGKFSATHKVLTLSGTVAGATSSSKVTVSTAKNVLVKTVAVKNGKYKVTGLIPANYTLSVTGNYRQAKTYAVHLTKSATKNVAQGAVTGAVEGDIVLSATGEQIDGLVAVNGNLTVTYSDETNHFEYSGTPGTYTFDSVTASEAQRFQPNAPYHLQFAESSKSFKIVGNTTTQLGQLQMNVVR